MTILIFQNMATPAEYLTYRNVTVLSMTGCKALWADMSYSSSLPSTALCVKNELGDVTTGSCLMEYGVPISTSDTRVLFGILAGYPNYCDGSNQPNLYTRTADVAKWILENSSVDGVDSL